MPRSTEIEADEVRPSGLSGLDELIEQGRADGFVSSEDIVDFLAESDGKRSRGVVG